MKTGRRSEQERGGGEEEGLFIGVHTDTQAEKKGRERGCAPEYNVSGSETV